MNYSESMRSTRIAPRSERKQTSEHTTSETWRQDVELRGLYVRTCVANRQPCRKHAADDALEYVDHTKTPDLQDIRDPERVPNKPDCRARKAIPSLICLAAPLWLIKLVSRRPASARPLPRSDLALSALHERNNDVARTKGHQTG